ncbi:DUF1833 family protein [Lysobacter soli]|uniref:DUF1833 family protein n=1 Tax=Lysobacter soli TaxID=453783 RepID=UPI0037C61026
MARVLSPTAARAILARETEEVFLVLLAIEHPDIATVRIVNNTEPVVRSDGTYLPYPFEAVLPEDTDTAAPQVQLRIDNCDREVVRQLRSLSGVPKCTMRVVLASNPNVDEVGPYAFSILTADYDALSISVAIGYEEDFLNQAVPAQTYTPTNSPGLFV